MRRLCFGCHIVTRRQEAAPARTTQLATAPPWSPFNHRASRAPAVARDVLRRASTHHSRHAWRPRRWFGAPPLAPTTRCAGPAACRTPHAARSAAAPASTLGPAFTRAAPPRSASRAPSPTRQPSALTDARNDVGIQPPDAAQPRAMDRRQPRPDAVCPPRHVYPAVPAVPAALRCPRRPAMPATRSFSQAM